MLVVQISFLDNLPVHRRTYGNQAAALLSYTDRKVTHCSLIMTVHMPAGNMAEGTIAYSRTEKQAHRYVFFAD